MSFYDPLIHPAMLDPRQWGNVNLYDATFKIEREPIKGEGRQTPDRPFAIKHLKLDLQFDEDRHHLSGTATLTLTPLNDNFSHFELDSAELNISSVTLLRVDKRATGDLVQAVTYIGTHLDFENYHEKISIDLDRPYNRKEYLTIEIAYSATPRKGLYFIRPDEDYPDKPRQIWSQCENEDAHWWFPCHDVPNQKMTTELIATVKSNYLVVSNGELIDARENPIAGTRTYHWSQTQPHPAYLVSVVIGEYDHIRESYDRLPVDYYVYRNRRQAGRKLFANTVKMIKFFEERFGYAYPFSKYAQILVDDFLFGAMENTSATTMTDRCLLDDRASIDLDYDDIVAHELAHQWWGDLVTCKDWTQIWLNESFATYAESLWREYTSGPLEARFELFQNFLVYLHEDNTSHRRPIHYNRYRFSEELMDRHAYEKGACVLDMLRGALGDDAFFRSLSHYLNKFEFGIAETNDFKVAIEETTGQNMYWFFDQWIYGAGYPELEVSYHWQREEKMLRLSVKQLQERDGNVPIFRLPVEIEIISSEAGEIIETERRESYRVVLEKAEQDFYFPCASKPRLVNFDKNHRIFKVMRFPKSEQELIFQLRSDDDALGRMRAARELSIFKSENAVQALRGVLIGVDFHGVRMAAAISLGEIGTESALAALIEGYRASEDSHVRRNCVLAMGYFKGQSTAGFLREALENDASYFVGVAAVRALANLGGDQAYDILASSLTRTSWQEVIASAIFHGFGHNSAWAKDRRVVDLAIEYSRYGKPAPVRVAAIDCLGALGKELNKDKADERVVDQLIELMKDKNIRARVSAIRALGKVGNKRAITSLQETHRRECLDQLKAASMDAIECLEKK